MEDKNASERAMRLFMLAYELLWDLSSSAVSFPNVLETEAALPAIAQTKAISHHLFSCLEIYLHQSTVCFIISAVFA